MENNTNLIVYDENGEISNCQFARVNLDQPATILTYCSDVKDQIGAILDSTAQMSISSENIVLDSSLISSISSFDESLDESEKQKAKKDSSIVRGFKNLLTRFGVEKYQDEEEQKTYKGRFAEYCRGIAVVVEAVEQQKQASLNDIELRNSIIEEMTPLIEQLEIMIQVGHEDKKTYDEETATLKQAPQNLDTEYQIQYREQLSEVFNTKLHELEKGLVLYKLQVQNYRLQQKTDMELAMQADSYIRDTAPVLKAQGSVMIFNRQQTERINIMRELNQRSNEAIVNNSLQLEQNVQATIDLALNQGITVDTLKKANQAFQVGVELFKKVRAQKQQQITAQRTELVSLNDSLNQYQQEVLQIIQDTAAVLAAIGDQPGTNTHTLKHPVRKELTNRQGFKK